MPAGTAWGLVWVHFWSCTRHSAPPSALLSQVRVCVVARAYIRLFVCMCDPPLSHCVCRATTWQRNTGTRRGEENYINDTVVPGPLVFTLLQANTGDRSEEGKAREGEWKTDCVHIWVLAWQETLFRVYALTLSCFFSILLLPIVT